MCTRGLIDGSNRVYEMCNILEALCSEVDAGQRTLPRSSATVKLPRVEGQQPQVGLDCTIARSTPPGFI